MNLIERAKITIIEYQIIKNSNDISFLKLVFIAFVFCNCDFNNNKKKNLIYVFFDELSNIYESKKNDLVFYFESILILKKTKLIKENNYRLILQKGLNLCQSLSDIELEVIHELEKVSDDVFYGMVIENV